MNKKKFVTITREGTDYSVTVELIKFLEWVMGENPIQVVFPDLTPDQREFIISGIAPDEWDKLFPEEEDTEFYDSALDSAFISDKF